MRIKTVLATMALALRGLSRAFGPQAVLLMTEKDAVKCAALPLSEAEAEAWVLPVTAQLPPALMDLIVEKLRGCSSA